MRVAHDHFFRDTADDVREVKVAELALDLAVKHDLQKNVSELLLQKRRVIGVDGLDRLVAFL